MLALRHAALVAAFALSVVAIPARAAHFQVEDSPDESLATLKGRVVLPDGSVAMGATVQVNRWRRSNSMERRLRLPDYSGEPSTTVGKDGAFELQCSLDSIDFLTLSVRSPSYASSMITVHPEKFERDVIEFDETTLVSAVSAKVEVLDKDRNPAAGPWSILAMGEALGPFGQPLHIATADVDPATGIASFDDLAPGYVRFELRSDIIEPEVVVDVKVTADETQQVKMTYPGPDVTKAIRIELTTAQDLYLGVLNSVQFEIESDEGLRVPCKQLDQYSNDWMATEVPEGSYTVRASGTYFDSYEVAGVKPGQVVEVPLSPKGRITVRIFDQDTDEEISDYYLYTRQSSDEWSTGERGLPAPKSAQDEIAVLPLDGWLEVRADLYGRQFAELKLSQGDHRQAIEIGLTKTAPLRGRVVVADGSRPSVRATIALRFANSELGLSAEDYTVASNPDGTFEMQVSPGTYSLQAFVDSWTGVSVDSYEHTHDQESELLLELPASVPLRVELKAPDLAVFRGSAITATPKKRYLVAEHLLVESRNYSAAIGLEPVVELLVPPGEVILSLESATTSVPGAGVSMDAALSKQLQVIDAKADEPNVATVDLASFLPGQLRIIVKHDGKPAAGSSVIVESIDGSRQRTSAIVDPSGVCVISGVFPGTYRVDLRPPDGLWDDEIAASVEVSAHEIKELSYDEPLVTGKIQVMDPDTGNPLASASIRFATDHGFGHGYVVGALVTDEAGWIELTLPPGSFPVESSEGSKPDARGVWGVRRAKLHWSADGPRSAQFWLGWL